MDSPGRCTNLQHQLRTALKFVILSDFVVSAAFTGMAYPMIGTNFSASLRRSGGVKYPRQDEWHLFGPFNVLVVALRENLANKAIYSTKVYVLTSPFDIAP